MVYSKIESLKDTIYTEQIKSKYRNILDEIDFFNNEKDKFDDKEILYRMTYIKNKIFEYFYDISASIFDTFVSEGGTDDYSYKSFKLFYLNIFYSYLKSFFIDDKKIKSFFESLSNKEYYISTYCMAEDSLFNYISLYYFNTEISIECKDRIEHILNNIIIYDCDSDEKEFRYKNILFTHYKESQISSLNKKINDYKKITSDLQREYSKSKSQYKRLKGIKQNYKKVENTVNFTLFELDKRIDETHKYLLELNGRYIYFNKGIIVLNMQLEKMKNLTKEEFERG